MIVVHKMWGNWEGSDPCLAYDAEEGELWGYPRMWESHVDKVGMTEEEFASFFDGPYFVAGKTDEDPFKDTPNAEDLLRNYPPGSEEIPDLETPEPAGAYADSGESTAEKITNRDTESPEGGGEYEQGGE